MALNLVIVESPAKCKKLGSFLGRDFKVVASMGHFRDLPPKGLGVDLETMQAQYVVLKPDVFQRLEADAQKAEIIYLCTDPDREGEAISWHLRQVLPAGKEYRRAGFQEITKKAVLQAIQNHRDIDQNLANAQQARRILDRLVGYKLSPELWKAFRNEKSLSAGRVQSVATRIIVDREQEIANFVEESYYKIHSHHEKDGAKFRTTLKYRVNGGEKSEVKLTDKDRAMELVKSLENSAYAVTDVQRKELAVRPQPPFTTSNMQAKAANVLGMSAAQSMQSAQKLYEGGHITYHRTDSAFISKEAMAEVRGHIGAAFGDAYLPDKPQTYANKAGAQEAHECIRPTHVDVEEPAGLGPSEAALYMLIWRQFVSSQMSPGRDALTTVLISAGDYLFEARGRVELFDGFRRLNRQEVTEKSQGKSEEEDEEKQTLPALAAGDKLGLERLECKHLKTKPPPRYTEASLIKKLEKEGIGRPSTYATILGTITSRKYVSLKGKKYHAEDLGIRVTHFLVANFSAIMEIGFTRTCESRLDAISEGNLKWDDFLRKFWDYFSRQLVRSNGPAQPAMAGVACPRCGRPVPVRESTKWPGRHFHACMDCQCYLETDTGGRPLLGSQWVQRGAKPST